ncbi:signal peptidase I [Treponema sp. OMZ 799]|uniref:signal peptidase I n=1 Tax=Treponema sp. OMZ 799 TaxID=2563668 RepID=UPI0020A57209|nr:signal peptidase I [Treponema sp. OMZ 799]UTC77711.1 signal peptidase I [Treponema sp. OMZ 799]
MLKNYKIKFLYFVCIIFFLILLKGLLLDIRRVSGPSMEPALRDGDYVIIFKAAYGIKHPLKNKYLIRWAFPKVQDIIVYRKDGRFTVKRCLGIPQEPIEFYRKLGYNGSYDYSMKVSGKDIPLTAVQFDNLGGMIRGGKAMKEVSFIPAGTVLAVGDNLDASRDSRDYGFVLVDGIYGKVFIWEK